MKNRDRREMRVAGCAPISHIIIMSMLMLILASCSGSQKSVIVGNPTEQGGVETQTNSYTNTKWNVTLTYAQGFEVANAGEDEVTFTSGNEKVEVQFAALTSAASSETRLLENGQVVLHECFKVGETLVAVTSWTAQGVSPVAVVGGEEIGPRVFDMGAKPLSDRVSGETKTNTEPVRSDMNLP